MQDHQDDAELAHWRSRLARWRRFAPVIGFVLLAAAVVVVASGDTMGRAIAGLRQASLTTVGLLLMSVLLSVGLTGSVFWALTRRYGHVPFGEMQALMASTTLANYLPLRPGLFARLAYHKTQHSIRARDGLRTVFEAIGLSALSLALAMPALAIGVKLDLPLGVVLTAPALLGVVGLAWRRTRLLSIAWMLRYAETMLTALRYHLAFGLAGTPVPAQTSVAVACVSMAASLVPFVSNGIGLREWAIGLLAPVLTGYAVEQGIVAELVNRAAEITIVIPTGLIGAAVLWRSSRQPTTVR